MATDAQPRHVLAVDGGDSKTDIAVVDETGAVVAALRWPRSSHLGLDHEGGIESLSDAVAAVRTAGYTPSIDGERHRSDAADVGVYCMAGVDLPADERRVLATIRSKRWSHQTIVKNDTFAVLRAGSRRAWGIGVVCGAGLNCVGVAADGRAVRFASLGELSGDLAAGGGWLGVSALGAGVRAADGRGERTALERTIAQHFGARSVTAVMEGIYLGSIPESRTLELAPLVFDAAGQGDRVARHLVNQLADEIIAMVVTAIRRLHLTRKDVDVVLGGGIFRTHDAGFFERLTNGICAVAPEAVIGRLQSPPVVGAILLGLDSMGAPRDAEERVRQAVTQDWMATLVVKRQPIASPAGAQA